MAPRARRSCSISSDARASARAQARRGAAARTFHASSMLHAGRRRQYDAHYPPLLEKLVIHLQDSHRCSSASAKADQRGRSGTALRPGSRAARRDSDAATAPGGAACCSGSQTLLKGRRGARRVRSARHSSPSRSRAARRCEDDVSPSACDAFATRAGGSQRRELRGAHAANAHRGAHHIACDRHERGEDRERPHRPLRALRPHSSDQGLGLARSSARGG